MKKRLLITMLLALPTAYANELCQGYGPQSPRDIQSTGGSNAISFVPAPAADKLNLCNIHTHTNAEHKGPGFSIEVVENGDKDHDEGYLCNDTKNLTEAELRPLKDPHFKNIKPGDTIEVHWVFSSCNVQPGEGLAACASKACLNPQLRVEAQVFLLVNDENAANFFDYDYAGKANAEGLHQPKSLPSDSGEPAVYAGSTTGTKYGDAACSPYQVTWSVRPQCIKLDINSLEEWGENNAFNEHHSHGVRELVEEKGQLSAIQ